MTGTSTSGPSCGRAGSTSRIRPAWMPSGRSLGSIRAVKRPPEAFSATRGGTWIHDRSASRTSRFSYAIRASFGASFGHTTDRSTSRSNASSAVAPRS